MGLARWYFKHNSFWNDADRRRHRARQAEKRRAAATRQKAARQADIRQDIDAGISAYLAETGRAGLTAQEIRDVELQLRATGMSNAEIGERMRSVRFWREKPGPGAPVRPTRPVPPIAASSGQRSTARRTLKPTTRKDELAYAFLCLLFGVLVAQGNTAGVVVACLLGAGALVFLVRAYRS